MIPSPKAAISIPEPTTTFVPIRSTSRGARGATTIITTAIGSMRSPASSAE